MGWCTQAPSQDSKNTSDGSEIRCGSRDSVGSRTRAGSLNDLDEFSLSGSLPDIGSSPAVIVHRSNDGKKMETLTVGQKRARTLAIH